MKLLNTSLGRFWRDDPHMRMPVCLLSGDYDKNLYGYAVTAAFFSRLVNQLGRDMPFDSQREWSIPP
jgi:hypothetical protein